MPTIHLTTKIDAPVERVFDLARSIDAHTASSSQSREKAVDGRTSGLIEEGESVTWEATHFFIKQQLTSRITHLDRPRSFQDSMERGAFQSLSHIHTFEKSGDHTLMHDDFTFAAPLGVLGRLAEKLFLTRYMRSFLEERNLALKRMAESDEWREFL